MATGGSRTAKVELKTSAAGVDAGLRDARRRLRAFERETLKNARTAYKAVAREEEKAKSEGYKRLGKAGGMLKGAALGFGAAAGFDLAGGVGGMVSDLFAVEKELTRFGIDANLSQRQLAEFRDETMKVSNATGVSRKDLTEAAHAYQILTGDADGATKSTALFADVTNAAGASTHDIAETAASMRKNLGIDPKDFRKGFDVLLNLGHKGSLELRDFAGEMSSINPQFGHFGDKDSITKLTEMGAAMEVIKYNFANASESATGFKAAMTAISKSKVSDRLAKYGVDVWRIDPATKQHVKRDFFDIMADIKKKIPDYKVLADVLGGRQESFSAITAILDHYKEMIDLRDQAANSNQVSVDSQKWMESSSGKIAMAWERIKNAIASALTPERVDAFANAMMAFANGFVKVIGVADEIWSHLHGENTKQEQGNYEWKRRVTQGANRPGEENSDIVAVYSDMQREDQLRERLQAQTQGVDWTKAGDEKRFGPNNGRKGVYSPQELSAMMGALGGSTNWSTGQAKALADAMAVAMRGVTIVVKADGNAIAAAGANAHIQATRPGGRK